MSTFKHLLENLREDYSGLLPLPEETQKELEYLTHITLHKKYSDRTCSLCVIDPEFEEHRLEHFKHPSINCHFCVQNADLPSPDEERMSMEEMEASND